MNSEEWCVAVFNAGQDNVDNVLVDFYDFAKDLQGVKDLHFLIRDRVDSEVIFSFRLLVEAKDRKVIKSKITYKLKNILPEDKFATDPDAGSPFAKYVAWSPGERIAKYGSKKFVRFCKFLSHMSRNSCGHG